MNTFVILWNSNKHIRINEMYIYIYIYIYRERERERERELGVTVCYNKLTNSRELTINVYLLIELGNAS